MSGVGRAGPCVGTGGGGCGADPLGSMLPGEVQTPCLTGAGKSLSM